MRLATFRPRDAPARLGAVLGTGQVVDLVVAGDRYLSTGERRDLDSAFQTLIAFLETGERAVQAARTIVVRVQEQIARGGGTLEGAYPLEDVRFLAPLSRPGKIIAVGLNYRAHSAEVGATLPSHPVGFVKVSTAICGPDDEVLRPPGTEQLDY
jgi:2-keto-4-pentenoate hydratase/2-oxohepta-3-ene-1,7-dioic acid hydratase in catechol pathway